MKARAKVNIPGVIRMPGLGSLMDHCAIIFIFVCPVALFGCVFVCSVVIHIQISIGSFLYM